MKKNVILVFLLLFILSIASFAQDRATIEKNIKKLEKEIVSLERKLKATKSATRKKRLKKIIDGHTKVIAEFNEDLKILEPEKKEEKVEKPRMQLEILSMRVMKKTLQNYLDLKGGFASGGVDLGLAYFAHFRGLRPGVGLGYSIGNQYSVLRTDLFLMKEFGLRYLTGELTYASFSEKVSGLLGTGDIEKGGNLGIGLTFGMYIGRLRAEIGYNTVLGANAHAVYRILL